MVQSCLIIGCKSRYNKNDGISFFSFPSNKIESEKWRDSILNNQKGVITKNSKICQFHFNESDIKRHGVRTVLKKGAKPTIFHNQRNSTEVNEFMDVEYLELGESLALNPVSLHTVETVPVSLESVENVRSFALTLNFYSPRAYRYVRKTFANKLPTPRTIRKWYESVDAEPGITEEALKALAIRVDESKKKGVYLRFCLSMDEMSIRKQIEYSKSRKKFYGYVDVGGASIDHEGTVVATKALVLMLTAINGHFKIPVSYFLTNGLTSYEQANVVNMVLRTFGERGVAVVALVFDGAATNISMINVLNRSGNNATYFHHPLTKEQLFINEISLWKLPPNSDDCDETCVDVTIFDKAPVPINGFVFGKNGTMNRGLHFQFVLNSMPTDDMNTFFTVSKKAYNRPKNLLGTGNIPINKIFSDIFSQTFDVTQCIPNKGKMEENGLTDTMGAQQKADAQLDLVFSQNESPSQFSSISKLSKDVYPIIGVDSQQWGTACILMRLTSFSDFSAHPIHIHQSHNEIILQNTPNSAMYKCIPLDDLRKTHENLGYCEKHPPINCCTDLTQSDHMNCNVSDSDLIPRPPPATPRGVTQYEEFKAEINDNVLCVRIPKNVGAVKRIYDKGDSLSQECYFDHSTKVYSDHIRKIPVIRGNRKYPAHYGALPAYPRKCADNHLIYDERERVKDLSIQCNENEIRNNDKNRCPSDFEILTKNNDPKRDVYLLKIGKKSNWGQNEIQLEMKTPKNPLARRLVDKFTSSSQTYEDEFVGQVKKSKSDKVKGGKKKTK
ncbi:DNA transposase THAP9 [Pseudolycoriella hygida]|uniref:DNA transposase THAP9 n=1 Tax=Pseudolycoriella hygida TaxID=35572 RepID=A0A9Q0SAG0_9DIPT|nr:DNA transposase THAP9 [Pseudolycoriella hygida]